MPPQHCLIDPGKTRHSTGLIANHFSPMSGCKVTASLVHSVTVTKNTWEVGGEEEEQSARVHDYIFLTI